jgi:hypothetical protein
MAGMAGMADAAERIAEQLMLAPVMPNDANERYVIHSDPRTWEHAPAGRQTSMGQTEAPVRDKRLGRPEQASTTELRATASRGCYPL